MGLKRYKYETWADLRKDMTVGDWVVISLLVIGLLLVVL
jgi:hypothetical protein